MPPQPPTNPAPVPTEDNARLAEISRLLYGDELELRVVDPRSLVLLQKNARYMAKEVFDQLTRNIAKDKGLQSMPLCHTLPDGRVEVLSGNHRVKAAIQGNLPRILILVYKRTLDTDRKTAIQLSHNAIVGQDDAQLLTELWNDIKDIEERLYSGLDSVAIGELSKINFAGFGPEQIRTEQVTLWFLPEEVKEFDKLLAAMNTLAGSKTVYLAPLDRYETLFKLIVAKKKSDNIRNTTVAFMALIDELVDYERSKATKTTEPVA